MQRLRQLLFEEKTDWIGPKIWRYLSSNPTTLLTLIYIMLSGSGLLYQYILFTEFGVSILDYSDVQDFLLAAFKSPGSLIGAIIIVISFFLYRAIANYALKRKCLFVRYGLLFFVWFGLLRREILIPLGIFYFFFFFAMFTTESAQRLVMNFNNSVTISTRSGNITKYSVIPIGSTKSFLFGIDFSDDLKAALKGQSRNTYRPVLLAFPFGDIIRIDYDNWNLPVSQSIPEPAGEMGEPITVRPPP